VGSIAGEIGKSHWKKETDSTEKVYIYNYIFDSPTKIDSDIHVHYSLESISCCCSCFSWEKERGKKTVHKLITR